MNTAMSSKRTFEHVGHGEAISSNALWAVAFFAGLVLLVAGVKTDIALLAGAGFVGVASGMLYFNSMFWAKVLKDYKPSDSYKYYI